MDQGRSRPCPLLVWLPDASPFFGNCLIRSRLRPVRFYGSSFTEPYIKEVRETYLHEPSSTNWPVAAIAARACPQFKIRRSSGSFSSASVRVYVLDLFASRNRSLNCFMLLNSFVSNWNAFLSDSVDAASETNLRLCCALSLKLVIQSSVIGNPRWTALIRVLRHSLITDICSMPALRNSFVSPCAAVVVFALEGGNVNTI